MEEQFISYDLALKLKELGFDEPCVASYLHKSYSLEYIKTEVLYINERFANGQEQIYDGKQILCLASLWQQAFDFMLLKFHRVSIKYHSDQSGRLEDGVTGFITSFRDKEECLTKLIELCLQNKI